MTRHSKKKERREGWRMPADAVLVRDDRAFDTAMVGSALKFLKMFHGPVDSLAALKAAAPFAWVPRVSRIRARLLGRRFSAWTLELPTPKRVTATAISGALTAAYPANDDTPAKHCNTLATRFDVALVNIQGQSKRGKDQWLTQQLRTLEFISGYRKGKAELVTMPLLKSVEACLLYALAVLAEDNWHFRDRVGECPYVRRHDSKVHFEPRHWFFDVDARGQLPISAPLKFCCADHANAYRQRQLRQRQAAAKHK
jgi:hypothetical protein